MRVADVLHGLRELFAAEQTHLSGALPGEPHVLLIIDCPSERVCRQLVLRVLVEVAIGC